MKIHIDNEYGLLKSCVVTLPHSAHLGEPLNLVQAHYFSTSPPDPQIVHRQYRAFENLLIAAGTQLHHLHSSDSPFQLFTRDIGFAIGKRLFISSMKKEVRQKEIYPLKAWLATQEIPATECLAGSIEGGDVLVDSPFVYVGIGARTSEEAADWLDHELGPSWQVLRIYTHPDVLHLDCVLSIVGPDMIVYCPSLIGRGRELIEAHFPKRLEISEQDVFDMACNMLSLNPGRLIVEAHQSELQSRLDPLEFHVESLDWGEIRKFGGLFRCAVCPLERSTPGS